MSKVKRDPHNIRRNISLNDKYLSNDGGNEGITIDDNGLITASGTISLKEQSSAPTNTAGTGRLWVKDDNPTSLYFTDDTETDIQLTSDGLLATATIARAVGADDITTGDAQVNIGTSSGDIVFKSNDSSGTEEWLTFNTNQTSDTGTAHDLTEILGKSNQKLRIRSVGTQLPFQLVSGSGLELSHYTSFDGTSTTTGSILKLRQPHNFSVTTCDWDASPGLDDGTGTDPPHIQHDAATGGVADDPSDDALDGKIHIEMYVEAEDAGIPYDETLVQGGTKVASVQSATFFQIDKTPTADATNETVNFSFPWNKTILSRYAGSITAEWEVHTSTLRPVNPVANQTSTSIPAQLRGSTSGARAAFMCMTNSVGQPIIKLIPSTGGSGYITSFSDATCDYNHSTGLNADASGGDSDLEDKSTIIHDDDNGAIKLYMSVVGEGIPIGSYVGEVVSNTCCRIHRGGGTGAISNLAREAVTTTATNGTLTFYDRVCLQDPDGSGSNYGVVEVGEAKDGAVVLGSHTTAQMNQGVISPQVYFDFNEAGNKQVTSGHFMLMGGKISIDSDTLFLAGPNHTADSGQDYTFVHGGDRMFFGSSNCNTCDIFIDSTTATRRLWIGASNVPNGVAQRGGTTAWEAAGGLEIAVANTDGETTFETRLSEGGGGSADMNFISGGEMNFTPLAVGGTAEFSKAYTGTTNATSSLVFIDYDAAEDTASGHTINHLALDINLNTDSQTAVGTVNNVGIDLDMVGGASGTQTNTGINIAVSGAGTNYPIITSGGKIGFGVADPDAALEILNTATQLKLSYDIDSYATIAVNSSSNTTIASAESGNIMLDAAGDIILDADGANITLQDGGSTYTPAAASDATTKTYVDSQTVITANAYNNRVNNTSWFLMNNDTAQDLTGTDTSVGDTQDLGILGNLDMRCLMYIVPFNMTVHAVAGSVMDDDNESTTDKRMGIWRLPSLAVSGADPGDTNPDTLTLAYITDGFGVSGVGAGKVCAFYDTSADFALTAGDGIFMAYLNPQSAGMDDVTLTMSIWAHQTA